MSYELEPQEIENVDNRVVERYDLPERDPLVLIDIDSSGYTAEWPVNMGLSRFEEFVDNHMVSEDYVTASFEPDDEPGFSVEEELQVLQFRDDLEYPGECTYLLVEEFEYDLAWEAWDDINRLMIQVPSHDSDIFEELFLDSMEEEHASQDLKYDALDQVRQVIDSTDYTF